MVEDLLYILCSSLEIVYPLAWGVVTPKKVDAVGDTIGKSPSILQNNHNLPDGVQSIRLELLENIRPELRYR